MTEQEEKNYYKNIGSNARFYRINEGLRLKDVAKLLGVSTQQVQKYEKADVKLPAKCLKILSEYYNIDLTTFVGTRDIVERPKKNIADSVKENFIPKKLKAFRTLNDKTQADVANILGVTYQQYQKYETGVNRTPIASLQILANEYKVSLDQLMTGDTITFSFGIEPKAEALD